MKEQLAATLLICAGALPAGYAESPALRNRMEQAVKNEKIAPIWAADDSALYYQAGDEVLRVDTQSGHTSSVVKTGMLRSQFKKPTARILRFTVLETGDFICMAAAGKEVHSFRITGKKIEKLDASANPFTLTPHKASAHTASGNGGIPTKIIFINNTAEPADIVWVDSSRVRNKLAVIQPGQTLRQNTTSGHAFIAGDLVFTAEKEPAFAYLADQPAPPESPKLSRDWKVKFRDHNLFVNQRGKETQLTTDGSADGKYCRPVHWSPCGRYLIAMREKKGTNRRIDLIESAPKDQLQPRTKSIHYPKPGDELNVQKPHLFDLQTGHEIPLDNALFSNPWNLSHFHWSPDGDLFFFLYNERGHQTMRLLSIETAIGKIETVLEETSPTFIDYTYKTYLHHLDKTDEVIWMSERSGWNHLYLINRTTGKASPVTGGDWVVRGIDRVDPEARRIWFRAGGIHPEQDPYNIHYARINFDGTGLTVLTEGNGTHDVRFSNDWKFYTDTWSRTDRPPVHELRRASDGKKIADLGKADASELLSIHPNLPEPFVAKGREGKTDIYGVIFRPSHFDPSKKYPVIESIYAGPHGQFVPKGFKAFRDPQRLAELGFIVVQIDGMGTNWRSKKFHDICWKNLKDAGFPDRIAWMKTAAEKYPSMDISRVGIYGGSAGGQNAMRAVLDHADFYKAAAADCGCHDNRMDKMWWNEAWMGWPVDESYVENSNVADAHNLGGKLLLTVGMLDSNVDPSSTLQVVDALIKADKDFEFIAFPSKGHSAGESPYGKRRREEFFVRHLLNDN